MQRISAVARKGREHIREIGRAYGPFDLTLMSLGAYGPTWALILDVVFTLCGIVIMVQFIRAAQKVEPFTRRG